MRDFKIDGKTQRVFVLRQSEKAVVYIPVKVLTRVDYDRLKEIEAKSGSGEMLAEMKKTKLDNGRNALALYDNIIQVARLDKDGSVIGSRVLKPGESVPEVKESRVAQEKPSPSVVPSEQPTTSQKEETPKKRGRGRPPKDAE